MPRAVAISRVRSFMADPMPAFSSGTAAHHRLGGRGKDGGRGEPHHRDDDSHNPVGGVNLPEQHQGHGRGQEEHASGDGP